MVKKGMSKEYLIAIIFAYITILGMRINIHVLQSDRSRIVQFFDSLPEFSIYDLAAFVSLCMMYFFLLRFLTKKKAVLYQKAIVAIPAFLFSIFMVLGKALADEGSLYCIKADLLQQVKALMAVSGYFLFFLNVLAFLYILVEQYDITCENYQIDKTNKIISKFLNHFINRPFLTTFTVLLVVYIPYILISYPAIHFGDTCNQIAQGYNFSEGTSEYLNLIDENVRLNGHHPIIHTLFIHLCMVIGKGIFQSYNAGIFLVALTQLLCVLATMSFAISVMVKNKVKLNVIFAVVLYFAFSPRIQNYMFYITKDIFYACVLLLFGIGILKAQDDNYDKKSFLLVTLSGIAICLIRNDGKYIAIMSIFFVILFCKKNRAKNCISILLFLFAIILMYYIIMPVFHITPTSKREALSIPFQQTARYLRDYKEEVTPEEYEAISRILICEDLSARYDPVKADPVKECYNEFASEEELRSYFKVWFQMFKKHPQVYFEATLNNYYNYFYPGEQLASCATYEQSAIFMTHVNDALEEIGMDIHYPEWSDIFQQMYETLREKIFEMPVLSLFLSPAAYVWLLIAWFFYLLWAKDFKAILSTMPMLLSLCIAFAGPRNGDNYRYLYAITVSLPVIIALNLQRRKAMRNDRIYAGDLRADSEE